MTFLAAALAAVLAAAPTAKAARPPPPVKKAPAPKVVEPPPAAQTPPPPEPAKAPDASATPEELKRKALRVAVLEPTIVGEVDRRALAAFVDAMVPEVRKLDGVSVIGMGEVREMLEFERERQLLGCSEESCLSEIAGALGVDEVLTTQLTLVGSSYALSMRRMNMRKAKVVGSETKRFEKRDGEEVLAMVGPLVAALFPDMSSGPGAPAGSIRRPSAGSIRLRCRAG